MNFKEVINLVHLALPYTCAYVHTDPTEPCGVVRIHMRGFFKGIELRQQMVVAYAGRQVNEVPPKLLADRLVRQWECAMKEEAWRNA